MKEIKLTQGYAALVDDEDFERVSQYTWQSFVERRKDGSIRAVYAVRNLSETEGKRRKQKLHRFILSIFDSKVQIDHKNHDGLDCQRRNLRTATNSQNSRNARLCPRNTSGFKGAYWYRPRKTWRAQILLHGKRVHLGYYKTVEEAALAYDVAAREYFGEFALTNFQPKDSKNL